MGEPEQNSSKLIIDVSQQNKHLDKPHLSNLGTSQMIVIPQNYFGASCQHQSVGQVKTLHVYS
jgi:hypothetical protein